MDIPPQELTHLNLRDKHLDTNCHLLTVSQRLHCVTVPTLAVTLHPS